MSKRSLEKRVENLESPEDWENYTISIGSGPENLESPEGSIAEDLRENLADLENKDPSEIKIEDDENPISELVSRIAEAMEDSFEWESGDNELSPKELEEPEPEPKPGPEEKEEPEKEPEPEEIGPEEKEEPEKEPSDSLFIDFGEKKLEKYRNPRQRPKNAEEAAPEVFKK